jgi:hypothetical protein
MKIQDVNGRWWNEESNCWTVSELGATEYDGPGSVPDEIDDLSGDVMEWEPQHCEYYFVGDVEPVAKLV